MKNLKMESIDTFKDVVAMRSRSSKTSRFLELKIKDLEGQILY